MNWWPDLEETKRIERNRRAEAAAIEAMWWIAFYGGLGLLTGILM